MNELLLRQACSIPWALHRDHVPGVISSIAQHGGLAPAPTSLEPDLAGHVAVLRLRGVILHHPGSPHPGGLVTYSEVWARAFDELIADPSVSAIVLDVDTPGGMAAGTPELADRIYAARGAKPILAVSNALMASAGYWIGTAADRLYVTPSGVVGSIGVFQTHVDMGRMFDRAGIDITMVYAGRYKIEANAFEPLGDEAEAEIQRHVDAMYADFVQAVARHRAVKVEKVLADFGQGRVVLADEAVRRGMADGVATLEEVVAEAAKLAGAGSVRARRSNSSQRRPTRSSSRAGSRAEVRNIDSRARDEGGDWPLVGVGVPYGRESADMGGWREVFEEGAFGKSLEGRDTLVLWQHDPRYVFGRTSRKTARVWEAGGALRYAAKPPDTQWARDAMESIRRGDVHQSSVAFRVPKGGVRWERRKGYDLRIVSRAELVEVGPQTLPAYEDTSVAVRERKAWLDRRGPQLLHGAGLGGSDDEEWDDEDDYFDLETTMAGSARHTTQSTQVAELDAELAALEHQGAAHEAKLRRLETAAQRRDAVPRPPARPAPEISAERYEALVAGAEAVILSATRAATREVSLDRRAIRIAVDRGHKRPQSRVEEAARWNGRLPHELACSIEANRKHLTKHWADVERAAAAGATRASGGY